MEIAGVYFQAPWWLLGMLASPIALWLAVRRAREGGSVVFPGAARAVRIEPSLRQRLRGLPAVLLALGILLGFVALARPQKGTIRRNVTTQGIDIVVALDVSGSMAAEDFRPNRLQVAKNVVADFIKKRDRDRMGLVIFAGRSLTKVPPTTDQGVLLKQLDDVHLDALPDGTAIGSGMATALTRLRHSKAKSRVIVLVTDGENNAGEIDPATATDIARAMQVRVYTIGVGSEGAVPMPVKVQDPMTGAVTKRTVQVDVGFDDTLLRNIAERTGGEYFHATDPKGLRAIFARIDKLERSKIKHTAYRRYREAYVPLLQVGLGILALAGLAWVAGLRVAPS